MDTSNEERIKLKLDTDEEMDRRFAYSGDKENQSSESNREQILNDEPWYLSQYLETNLGIGKYGHNEREFKQTVKNSQSKKMYMNESKTRKQNDDSRNKVLTNYNGNFKSLTNENNI